MYNLIVPRFTINVNMKKYYILFLLVVGMLNTYAQVSDTLHLSYGVIYVSGKISDRQIYLKKAIEIKKITSFKPWEEIKNVLLSRDEKYILIYHKTNQEPGHNLSILDLSTFSIIKTIKPGYGGILYWTSNNNILLIWGCGSACGCFRLYDMELQSLAEECGSCLKEFIREDILVSLPCTVAQQGLFKIYSLGSGSIIKEISFIDKYSNYYALDATIENEVLKVDLQCGTNMDSLVVEKIKF